MKLSLEALRFLAINFSSQEMKIPVNAASIVVEIQAWLKAELTAAEGAGAQGGKAKV